MKHILRAIAAGLGLLGLYFLVLTVVSGWSFAASQFEDFWYFILSLAAGFGIQIGLYSRLRELVSNMHGAGKMVGVTGATSTAAMISCCAHYLANILPVLGTVGVVTFAAQYQIEFFWFGIAANLIGIWYIGRKNLKFRASSAL